MKNKNYRYKVSCKHSSLLYNGFVIDKCEIVSDYLSSICWHLRNNNLYDLKPSYLKFKNCDLVCSVAVPDSLSLILQKVDKNEHFNFAFELRSNSILLSDGSPVALLGDVDNHKVLVYSDEMIWNFDPVREFDVKFVEIPF